MFYPHGSKEKISGSDFEIRATNFKKQATNFSPSERKTPRKRRQKSRICRRISEEMEICSVYESTKSAQCQNLWQIIRA